MATLTRTLALRRCRLCARAYGSRNAYSSDSSSTLTAGDEAASEQRFLDADDELQTTARPAREADERGMGGEDADADSADAQNAARTRSMASTAFVRSADGVLPDIHAALSLVRALAFAHRDGGSASVSLDHDRTAGAAARGNRWAGGQAGSAGGSESALREFSFARGQEQRQYLGYGSFTFSNPDSLAAVLRTHSATVNPPKYFVSHLPQSTQTDAEDPMLSPGGRQMVGLADISSLIGLRREDVVRDLRDEEATRGLAATDEKVDTAAESDGDGSWIEYKLERRFAKKQTKVRTRRPQQRPRQES